MEGVRRVGVQHKGGSLGRLGAGGQRVLHLGHGVDRNAGIGTAVQAQHRAVELGHHIHRMHGGQRCGVAHQTAIPGHTGLDVLAVRGIQPSLPPTPAKAGHAHLVQVAALCAGPGHGGIQVGHHLRIGHLGNHFGDQLGHFAVALGIALAHKQLGGNGQVARFGKAAGGVGNVFMHTKNLGQDQHHRQVGFACRSGPVGRHLEAVHVNRHVTGGQAIGRGFDGRLRHDGRHGCGIAHAHSGLEGGAPGGAVFGGVAGHEGLHVRNLFV